MILNCLSVTFMSLRQHGYVITIIIKWPLQSLSITAIHQSITGKNIFRHIIKTICSLWLRKNRFLFWNGFRLHIFSWRLTMFGMMKYQKKGRWPSISNEPLSESNLWHSGVPILWKLKCPIVKAPQCFPRRIVVPNECIFMIQKRCWSHLVWLS